MDLKNFELLFTRPAQVQIDLTNKCNLDCIYCYNKHNSLGREELNDEDLKNIITKIINQLGPLFVSFSGGEPLVKKDLFFFLAKQLKDNKIEVYLNTNGLLIDEEVAKKLNELKIDKINLNIDSLKIQDKIRGKKNLLSQTLNSLKILKKYYPKEKISIACVINKLNYKEILNLAKFVKEEGYMELHILDMVPSNDNEKKLILSKEEWLEFFEEYKKIKKLGILVRPNHALLFLSEFEKEVKIPFCMAGRVKMIITADGSVIPCNYFRKKEFICGDAVKENLLEIWQNSPLLKKFRYFMPKEEKCQKCNFLGLCTGGCRAFSYYLKGDLNLADPYCIDFCLK